MINSVPSSWEYSDELENLFLFYQASEEMLSFESPDSYRVTVHNVITLCSELGKIYSILQKSNQLSEYYEKYTLPIIEELLYSIQQDSIIKNELGQRLESVVAGLKSAKKESSLLMRWINIIKQSCSMEKYIELCKKRIEACIFTNSNKKELLFYINSFYVCLITIGFEPEYLYQSIKRFFDNRSRKIIQASQIRQFFEYLEPKEKNFELYFVADTYLINGFVEVNPEFKTFVEINTLNEEEIKKEAEKSPALKVFLVNYDRLKSRESISMISYKSKGVDPYCVLSEAESYFDLLQLFNGYFKHKAGQKIYFDVIQKAGDKYYPIKARKIIPSRPYLEQEIIDKRIRKLLTENLISHASMQSIMSALNMHLDAINCRSEDTMLRTFWTATEALLFDPMSNGERENAIYSLQRIIEKTYILKLLRIVYSQIISAVDSSDLSEIGITDFSSFVLFFASNKQDSSEYKKLTSFLGNNPLLRSRVYNLRKELTDAKHIQKKIEQHNEKIKWQLLRIYRTRNLSTHAGIAMPYMKDVLFNLHNYVDYVVNLVICKMENDEYIPNISSVVFEAKNDNQIHIEMLKKGGELSKDNYIDLLFGPDRNLLCYEFETNFAIQEDENIVSN